MKAETDVAVIGAGLAGLTAAAYAARSGARVTLFEARSEPGGRARSVDRDGFILNEGAHALYRKGAAMPLLRELGVTPDGWVPPTDGLGLLNGRLGVLPTGPLALVRTSLLGPAGKAQVARLLVRLGSMDTTQFDAVPLGKWIDDAVSDQRARHLLRGLVRLTTYGHDSELSAGAALRQLQRAVSASVLYLHGGWQSLVDGLNKVARDAGVEFRSHVKIGRVAADDSGVELDAAGTPWRAGATVVAVGGSDLTARLLGRRVDKGEVRPATAAALDVCFAGAWGGPRFVLGLDQPIYLSEHAPHIRVAPEGASLVSLMRYRRPDETPDPERDRAELEAVLDLVRPNWKADAVHVRFLQNGVAATDLPSAARGGEAGRPAPEVAPNLFVAGDWVGPVGLLADAAVASGALAGRTAARVASEARLVV